MREQLNALANQLTDLAAQYEEKIAPIQEWNTEKWQDLCYKLSKDRYTTGIDIRDMSPEEAVSMLHARVTELTSELTYRTGGGWRDRIQATGAALNRTTRPMLDLVFDLAPGAIGADTLPDMHAPAEVADDDDEDHPEQDTDENQEDFHPDF
jgi:hypothetical protein